MQPFSYLWIHIEMKKFKYANVILLFVTNHTLCFLPRP